tara:strand:- start:78 stop:2051 length:1974 start_codon:yes stop_codon:yes gene_type:complete
MNRSILLLLPLILIAGIFVSVDAQTISQNVVINEVDTNPSGDDSQSISEWVELFNPTDSDVDISNWEIASTTVLKKVYVIPDGTIIASGEFLIFVNEKVWFTDTAESVELKNQNGLLIDQTREIFDLENNFKSWQRIFDGSSEWKFASSTAGSSNGKEITNPDFTPVVVTASVDNTSYVFNETVIISGTVSEKLFVVKPSFQTEPILINISGPNFYQTVSLYPDSYLNYETTLNLVQVLGINEGNYDVIVSYGGVSSKANFSVGSIVIEKTEDTNSSLFSIETNASEFLPGSFISINGNISDIIPYQSVKFNVNDPNGKSIENGNLFPSDGQFSTELFLTNINPVYGTYQIIVEYGQIITSTSFELVSKNQEIALNTVESNSLIVRTDNSEYLLNELFTVSGIITNFDNDPSLYAEHVQLSFKDSAGNSPFSSGAIMDSSSGIKKIDYTLSAIIDSAGEFSVSSKLLPVVFFNDDYIVKATYGSLDDSTSFSIVSEKSEESDELEKSEPVFNVKTVIKKVNRISDNLISINTQEQIIDEQLVKPRVLSGSMITSSKDSQSNVNLRVESNSGICIIGNTDECLVSESTRKPGQIFEVVQVDDLVLNVRYTGHDVRLEKFSILPASSDKFLPDTNWNIEVIKDNEISRFYYKITYKTLQ